VSRRTKRRRGSQRGGGDGAAETGRARAAAGGDGPGEGRQAGSAASRHAASGWSLGVQLAFLVAVFAVVVLVAELAGAANLGVALGVGQIAFAIAVVYLLVRR
jgi:hypothetical protein